MARKYDDKTRLRVRTAFIVKGWSAEKCGEEFNLAVRTVKEWATREGWNAERTRLVSDGQAIVEEELREVVADGIRAHLSITDRVTAAANDMLGEADRLRRMLPDAFDEAFQKAEGNAERAKIVNSRMNTLRGITEIYLRVTQMASDSIRTGRLVRGIQDGQASAPDASQGPPTKIEYVIPTGIEAAPDNIASA